MGSSHSSPPPPPPPKPQKDSDWIIYPPAAPDQKVDVGSDVIAELGLSGITNSLDTLSKVLYLSFIHKDIMSEKILNDTNNLCHTLQKARH